MESWRERGFVPDSDSEDGFESQETLNSRKDDEHSVGGSAVAAATSAGVVANTRLDGSQNRGTDPLQEPTGSTRGHSPTLGSIDEDGPPLDHLGDEPSPPADRSYEEALPHQAADENEENTPRARGKLAEGDKALKDAHGSASSTPRAPEKAGYRDISSSEDELQFEHMRSRKPARVYTRVKRVSEPQQPEMDYDISTPSSPLSSLDSLRLEDDDEHDHADDIAGDLDGQTRQGEETSNIRTALEDLMELDMPEENLIEQDTDLPPLDIPEHLLDELSQPARRSLRERKAIQLHPYMLEDAKYRNLMRARGVKPVRVAQQEINRLAAEESQNQDYVDQAEPMSDSLGAEFEYLPSSPLEPRRPVEKRSVELSPERHHHQALPAQSTNRLVGPHIKRRKLSKTPNDHQTPQTKARLQVVIDNGSFPARQADVPVFDIPSPPRSEDDDLSSEAEPSKTFRFPRGFTPALNTPNGLDDGQSPAAPSPLTEERHAVVSEAEQEETDNEKNDEDDAAIRRRYQRRIKGVLPASWLRSAQRAHERLTSRADDSRGVARKIMKNRGDARPPSSINALRQLADSDSEEDPEDREADDETASRQLMARLGLENPFLDEDLDDDIPEDNRIDNIIKARKHVKKHTGVAIDGVPSKLVGKRSRLQRQARLTDPRYRAQKREKQKAPDLPKIGVLDAPDVVVAARKARSRQDKGRRSPSRKVFKLNSRADTEEANVSLREWRAGNLRQTRLPNIQTKPPSKSQAQSRVSRKTQSLFSSRARPQPSGITTSSLLPAYLPRGNEAGVDEHRSNMDSTTLPQMLKSDTVAKNKSLPKRSNNKWIIQRNFAVTSFTRNGFRPALVEKENLAGRPVSSVSFQRTLSLLNRDYRGQHLLQARRGNLLMDRFISSRSSTPVPRDKSNERASANMPDKAGARTLPLQVQSQRREARKRPPRRLDINAFHEQESQSQLHDTVVSDLHWRAEDLQPTSCPVGALEGLQRTYTIEFNITPLIAGTFFHESTFIGSGEFRRSLNVLARNLDIEAGFFTLYIEDERYRWNAWNDAVSSGLGIAFDKIVEELDRLVAELAGSFTVSSAKQGCIIYRSLVKYITENLSFIDPVDRTGFVKRAQSLVCKVNDTLATLVPTTESDMEYLLTISTYNTVFANVIFQIAGHDLVEGSLAHETLTSMKLASKQAVSMIASELGQSSIRRLLGDLESTERREAGIRCGNFPAEAYVIVRHVLRNTDILKGYFEDLLAQSYTMTDEGDVSNSKNVTELEAAWHRVFTTLPLNEFDVRGIAQIGSRFRQQNDNWPVIKMLLCPALESYEATSAVQPVSYYNYCRALFHRCFHLINGWGWRDCKPVLDTLYDFFAKNTLYNLRHEESYRSPAFLDELDRNPSLDVQPGEPCFHILLKIIASGLRSLSKSYDKRKIRNFAWRLLPNHGRMYPKEKPVQQTDLDALRNHHDLLCTLYYAVPDGCRPRLETIRDLVQPASSHRETCNISLRSWDRLVRFKLSTDEEVSGLEPFADWHCYFVTELLKQHAMARQEIEAQNTAGNHFSNNLVEKTIAQNQRQIESLLKIALSSLQGAVRAAPTVQHAQKLVSKMPVKALLGLFNPQLARVNTIVTETLLVILAYLDKCNVSQAQASEVASAPVAVDDDSQEYGDWTDIEAVYDQITTISKPEIEYVEQVFHPAVSRLVSNCFGEDYCPEDAILLGAVECWTSIAQTLAKHGLRHWDSYLSPYSGDSWSALRSTMQTRKFTPFFLASCIEKDARFVVECRVNILGMWMASLVERVALLKFQHRLTEALLNQAGDDLVLRNLPFALDCKQGRYSLTLEDITQRRLSLISSLLSNMRSHLQNLDDAGAREYSSTKQEYGEMIQKMMSSMKANYQELGNGTKSVQGTYVDLVHRVVGFLQQHSRDICPIDPFFTDPASFPLPSADPTYIVARLKSYEPKISSEKVAKTLVVFVQSVSERAAIDGQQDYLVNQLHSAMAETYERGNPVKPTLRSTLLQAVFPAYLEIAFSSRAAWILSRPVILNISLVFKSLLFNLDSTDSACTGSIMNIFASVFEPSYHSLQLALVNNVNLLNNPATAITAASFFDMITSALPIIDYFDRGTINSQAAVDKVILQIRAFRQLALFTLSQLCGEDELHLSAATSSGDFTSASTTPTFFSDLRRSATRELQSYIHENWSCHQGKYYFTRRGGHQPQEVEMQPAVAAQLEQSPLLALTDAAHKFLDILGRLGFVEEEADE
ncbi:uncharacterized protein BO97DRAFT_467249 [Aspergillus homomorphus CBS 101889]|uniref:Mus7/MMS22 family-domain-containing protein n=1 Tax=Aspergillus homomorphus (strain CBS 101889) TaxID=1450537 RepID=A0A395IC56_ASPHC|nr:hypothetical protein BO97DRAFT_467249 [Aspergillus homomorphus CBS 101889]RAL17790.1 hypothetical protein BO97DRAFT_467249 [Aspergillus homomorphus CBS 101889]